MGSVSNREYKTVFEDYPYQKLFDSLGKGLVELETNSFEVGQIYIFIRKGLFEGLTEDLEIVKKILPMQLKQMFGEGNSQPSKWDAYSGSWSRPMFDIDGKKYYALDISDSFIMSCYELEGENLNNRFKYSSISAILSFFNTFTTQYAANPLEQSEYQGLIIKQFGNNSYMEENSKEGEWAYVFKILSNPLTRTFMNWTDNPFV